MKQAFALLGLLGIVSWSGVAAAGDHQICYQGVNERKQQTVVVHCRSDAPGRSCQINLPGGTAALAPGAAGGSVARFVVTQGTTHTASITFSTSAGDPSPVTRSCTTELKTRGAAFSDLRAATPELVSFSTDQSGLLMTGVWSHLPTQAMSPMVGGFWVPGDFTAIGGGTFEPTGAGAISIAGQPLVLTDVEMRTWVSGSRGAAHTHQGFAIGLKIQGLDARSQLMWHENSQTGVQQAAASVTVPAGRMGIGASVYAKPVVETVNPSTTFALHASTPTNSRIRCITRVISKTRAASNAMCQDRFVLTGWQANAGDLGSNTLGVLKLVVPSLPTELSIGTKLYSVQADVFGATSTAGSAPSVSVSGPEGYALAGVGVSTSVSPNTQFVFTKLLPRADLRGGEMSARNVSGANFTVTGFALGLRLVENVPVVETLKPVSPTIPARARSLP